MTQNEFISNLKRLRTMYPKWNPPVVKMIAVHSNDPFRILMSTILSLRTKDQTTADASERLFALGDTPKALSKVPVSKIEKAIYPVGFFRVKAKRVIEISNILINDHKSLVPGSLEALLALPGVGRKTANLVLSLGFNIPAICVDIHVHRISNRWGIVKTKTPEKTEFTLMNKIPRRYWRPINELMVGFGQTICGPIKTRCDECPVISCPVRKKKYVG